MHSRTDARSGTDKRTDCVGGKRGTATKAAATDQQEAAAPKITGADERIRGGQRRHNRRCGANNGREGKGGKRDFRWACSRRGSGGKHKKLGQDECSGAPSRHPPGGKNRQVGH